MMKKKLPGILAVAICSVFIFAGCAPAPAAESQAPQGELVLAITGEITSVESENGNTSITVDAGASGSDSTYQLMVLNVNGNTPIEENGQSASYKEGSLTVGDAIEVYLAPNTPVTASEPPMANPDKIVLIARAGGDDLAGPDVQQSFEGTITEITKDQDYDLVYVQKEPDGQPVDDLRAIVSAETIIQAESAPDQALTPADLKVGQKVTVTTDGRMTFSIPPQANAQIVIINDING